MLASSSKGEEEDTAGLTKQHKWPLAALRQDCKIDINSAFYRHPKEKLNINSNKYDLIKPLMLSLRIFKIKTGVT
jgi:hypothetical protein